MIAESYKNPIMSKLEIGTWNKLTLYKLKDGTVVMEHDSVHKQTKELTKDEAEKIKRWLM